MGRLFSKLYLWWQKSSATKLLVIGGILISAFVTGLAGYSLVEKKLSYDGARTHAAHDDYQRPNSVCVKIPPVVYFCPGEQSDARAEAQRSEDDLNVQEEMAFWTFVMALVSAGGLVLSVVGVALVYATFSATRQQLQVAEVANQIERKTQLATLRQVRAYVGLREIRVLDAVVGKPITFEVVLKNSGTTVARNLRVVAGTYATGNLAAAKFTGGSMKAFGSVVHVNAEEEFTFVLQTEQAATTNSIRHLVTRGIYQVVGGYFSYDDVFDGRRRGTFKGTLTIEAHGPAYVTAGIKNNRTS